MPRQSPPPTTPCFTPGTLIATARGLRPVETIRPGDRVVTRDDGLREVFWVGRRVLSFAELRRSDEFRPILIAQGALGGGQPVRDMLVSPRHRFLLLREGREEVLTPASRLVDGRGIRPVAVLGVSYLHLMFARHQVILADGVWTESFRPDGASWVGLANAQRLEIEALFPEIRTRGLDRLARPARELDDGPLWKRRMEARPERG
ncbi:MAG: Hint domain-containing protein [Paracoccaceae bacterium]|nr:Hint domain-containing protein [Paracoccaceae bacterium]